VPAPSTSAATAPAATAATRSATNGASTQRASAAAPAANATAYGVGVASYLDEDRANVERERLTASTTLSAIVMPYEDSGTTMYRVVIGRWPSASEAERAANDLLERGAINEARVMRLPRR
jgi:hypothetical protein